MCEDRGLSAFRTSAAGRRPARRRNPGSRRGARPCGLAQIGQAPGSRQPTPRPGAGPAPHPETRWAALAVNGPGDSVRGIGHRQPTHQATPGYRSIDRITTVGVPSRPVKDGCRALRRDGAHRCSRCRRERVKSPCPGCGSWRLLLPGTGRCATGRGPGRLAARSSITTRGLAWALVILHCALRDPWPSDPGSPAVRPGRADAARATTRHPVLRARTPTVLHGSAAWRGDSGAPARRGRPGPRPCSVVTPGRRGWHYGGCRRAGLAKTFLPGRIRQGPSMYEMEGLYPASPRQAGQLAGPAGAARRAPGPGTRASRPVSRLLSRSRGPDLRQ